MIRRDAPSAFRSSMPVLEVGLAVVLLTLELLAALSSGRLAAMPAAIVCCTAVALAAVRPAAATWVAACGLVMLTGVPLGFPSASYLAPLASVMSAAGRRDIRSATLLSVGGVGVSLWLSRRAGSAVEWAVAVAVWGLLYAVAWLIGLAFARLRQSARRDLSVGLEAQRRSIAAELHDNVAHEVSMIVIRAEAARRDPKRADQDLEAIAELGRQTNEYLRQLMSLLRVDEIVRPLSLQYALERAELDLTRSGLSPGFEVQGDLDALPPAVADTLARVVKEATNNMSRHATTDLPCSVLIRVADASVDAAFTNGWDGRRGEGLGLEGMRERIQVRGGRLHAGGDDGLWIVRVSLPY